MNHFDEQAKTWDDNPDKQHRAQFFAKAIIDCIQPKGKEHALEFGCGTGLLSFALKDAFKSITLVDNSQGMIDVLKEKIKEQKVDHFKPVCTDLMEDTSGIYNMDVIFTLMTMHHIHDLDQAFQVFRNILKHCGYLCIADLVEEDGSFHNPELQFDGHYGFEKDQLINKLEKHGFSTIDYSTPFVITKQNGKDYPLFLLIAQKD